MWISNCICVPDIADQGLGTLGCLGTAYQLHITRCPRLLTWLAGWLELPPTRDRCLPRNLRTPHLTKPARSCGTKPSKQIPLNHYQIYLNQQHLPLTPKCHDPSLSASPQPRNVMIQPSQPHLNPVTASFSPYPCLAGLGTHVKVSLFP